MRRLAARLGTLALLVACLASSARAQDPDGAEAAAQAYADAFAAQDWEAMARSTDPEDLARFADFLGVFAQLAADEIEDADALAEVDTPEDAFVAFMEIMIGAAPMMGDMAATAETEILGSVPEGDSLVHVVTRSSFSMLGSDVTGLEVVTARWEGTRWVVKLNEQMEGIIAGIEAMAADPSFLDGMGIARPEDSASRDPKKQ